MAVLPIELRNKLEKTIIEARDVAEAGAKAALEALAVHHYEPYRHMFPEQRKLRNHLRAKARQLGDKQNRKNELGLNHLVCECAYEHWHRMLFARFLAENDLLIEPEMDVAISLEECEELAKEEGKDLWIMASEFAQRMLPQIFRPNDPVLHVAFANEYRLKLEKLLSDLESAIFTANDSLGWVYQFWQNKMKKEVNDSGKKIGANELPAVTQLFTESYMVNFLIHNTIGAWWSNKVFNENSIIFEQAKSEDEIRKAVSVNDLHWNYLRFIRTDGDKGAWRPAAGGFEGWPKKTFELKVIDPCCGSGHFLVALLYHLVPLRMHEENISTKEAIDAVLRDNLYGLEIDDRCTQISVFAIALAAWTYPNATGYRKLPEIHIACSGIAPNVRKEIWISLADENQRLQMGMKSLYRLFQKAPILGSLIDLESLSSDKLFEAGIKELRPFLQKAISTENENYEEHEMAVSALGITDAVDMLDKHYHLIITNVPYLGYKRQNEILREIGDSYYPEGKADLATMFIQRLLKLCSLKGTLALVCPRYWLFLHSYTRLRRWLLKEKVLNILAILGPGAFQTISGEVVNVCMMEVTNDIPKGKEKLYGLDVTDVEGVISKTEKLQCSQILETQQSSHLKNPDFRITTEEIDFSELMENYAIAPRGIVNGDFEKWTRYFWELTEIVDRWRYLQSAVLTTSEYSGRERVIDWSTGGKGMLRPGLGNPAYGKKGVVISRMSNLPVTLYTGELYDQNAAVLVPLNSKHLGALWSFCSSPEFFETVRKIDQKLGITPATLLKIPFNITKWDEAYSRVGSIPPPESQDLTQWLFSGNILESINPLHVALCLLIGFQWPKQTFSHINKHTSKDGIICFPSVKGEKSGPERLRAMLVEVFANDKSSFVERDIIRKTGSNAVNFDEWLRDDFFEQHCRIFHHRPLIWHIWDGRKRDGFHALLNYHKIVDGSGRGKKILESLTYSYLGDWITRQKESVKLGEGGAEDRLASAIELQKRLVSIIEGEPPFDIFARWRPIAEQPIGWEPDINDGVRLNIRPFMSQDISGGRKGAGILRWRPRIKWGKDRGKDPLRPKEQYPWFWKNGEFTGDRINDIHLTNEEKRQAREKAKENK